MKKEIKAKSVVIVGFGALALLSVSVADKVTAFVSKGLHISKDMRASESTLCAPASQNSGDAHFTGCNSIL